jgi:uncharacterized membrane protein YbhN (UPF0104 family)
MRKTVLQNLAAYCIAGLIIAYLLRGISLKQVTDSIGHANLWIFVPASLASFLCWFLGETLLFSHLFSYFHRRTRFLELIPANAAQYFLQVINMMVAGGALVLFLHQRKKVPWLAGGCTLLFQSFVDWFVLATMAIVAALLVPSSKVFLGLPVAAGSLVLWFAIASFWMIGNPRLQFGKWVYTRPSMVSFRQARPEHYLKLILIRTPIFGFQGFVLYAQLRSFHVQVPLHQVLAFTPAVLVMGGLPITPVGLGPLQAVLMTGFSAFAAKAQLLTMALSISMMNLIIRIPLGLGSAGAFASEVSSAKQKAALGEPAVIEELATQTAEEIIGQKSAGARG